MEPGWFMRIMVLGCQGVFFNGFLLSYLRSPRICHRFVGYLEEEAFITYTGAIGEIDAAVEYWKMPAGHHTMRDLIIYIRADEAKYCEVNYTLSNLNQAADPNPYQIEYDDPGKPHPTKSLQNLSGMGWDRNDIFR
ncbi:alternative oxidase-domain-containing protein [Aspergillus minisclerotigenes]|uniref:Alternative oxidase n=1 Tax=Aspergillus minisclerotigenes TaxID=656917 RepID=A0A5N6ISW1_9EURO|nr:alternative oxidase-domain-containing protein [Aspergillus minisclerotigenes]